MRSENDPRERDAPPEPARRGEHNEIEYRNVDEEAEHDEAGSQGPDPGEDQQES